MCFKSNTETLRECGESSSDDLLSFDVQTFQD